MSEQELAGKVGIVTGAGRNIGRAIADRLARAGAAVIVNARSNANEADEVVRTIQAAGGKAASVLGDVVDPKIPDVTLDSAFHCVKACLPAMRKNGGAIVNIGGMSAHIGSAHRAHVMTAKAGLIGFTR